MDSNYEFKTEQEKAARLNDALDKLRTETRRHLRKYERRIKAVGEDRVKSLLDLHPDRNPEDIADEALRIAAQGQLNLPSPGSINAIEATTD